MLVVAVVSDPEELSDALVGGFDILIDATRENVSPRVLLLDNGPPRIAATTPTIDEDGVTTVVSCDHNALVRVSASHVPDAQMLTSYLSDEHDPTSERHAIEDFYGDIPDKERHGLLWRIWKLVRRKDFYEVFDPPVEPYPRRGGRRISI